MRMYRTGLPVLASRWGSTSSVGAASAALLPAGFFCFSSSSGRAAFSRSASRNASSRCCCFSSSSRRASSSSCCFSEGGATLGEPLADQFQMSSSQEEEPLLSFPAPSVPTASPVLFPAPSPVGSRGGSAGGAGSGAGGDSGEGSGEGSAGCSNAGMSFGSTTPGSSKPSSAITGSESISSAHNAAAIRRTPFIVCPPFCQKSGALGAPLLEYLRGYYISQLCQKPCTSSQSSSRSIRRVILSAASSGRAV